MTKSQLAAMLVTGLAACSAAPKPDPALAAKVATLKAKADADPILAEWTGPFGGVPPWDKAKADQFPAAFQTGLDLLLAEIDVVAQNPEPPTFANVMCSVASAGSMFTVATSVTSTFSRTVNRKKGSHDARTSYVPGGNRIGAEGALLL